jgi:hypothetical protein
MAQDNYTLGRGKVYFSRFKSDGTTFEGFRYLGNTPEFGLSIEQDTLDHYNSDEGIKEKDDSVPLEVNRTGSLTTDNIDPENVALFFFGSATALTQSVVASATETLADVKEGHAYKLGVTSTNPAGYFGIDETGFAVTDGTTPLVVATDYTIDYDTGMLEFVEGSSLAIDGATMEVTYAVASSTRSRVISGSDPVEGAIMFVTKNPKGANATFMLPYVKLSPNGDYALKGDEWQQIPLSIEVLKASGKEAIYRDGVPAYA